MTNPVPTALMVLAAAIMLTGCLSNRSGQMSAEQQKINDLNERALSNAEHGYDNDARKLLQEALQLASSRDDRTGQIITWLNLSRLSRHSNNPQLAAQYLEQALLLAKGTQSYADAAQEKALQELAANRLDQAADWAEAARAAEQGNLSGRRLNLLARIALLQGNKAEAARLAELAVTANSGDGMELERANSLRMLGGIKAQTGQFDKAEKMLQEALKLDKQHQAASSRIAADLDALAELAGCRQDPARKQEYLNRAKIVRENSQPTKKQ
jgi:tetratricopeptide (TPR) repeat protein